MKQVYGEQAIEIYDPIVLTPEDIIFPWEPTLNANQVYKYQLKVIKVLEHFLLFIVKLAVRSPTVKRSPQQLTKDAFYFILKTLVVFKIFKFLS